MSELEKTGLEEESSAPEAIETGAEQEENPFAGERVEFSFESRAEDVLVAAKVMDKKNRIDSRRTLQGMGILLILWMFVPNLFTDPTQILNWVMVALAVLVGWYVWKYPDKSNKTFAEKKAELYPRLKMAVTSEGIEVDDGKNTDTLLLAQGVIAVEYQNVFTIIYNKNHLLAIPQNQLGEDVTLRLRNVLRQGLGDRFEIMMDAQPRPGLFGKKPKQ